MKLWVALLVAALVTEYVISLPDSIKFGALVDSDDGKTDTAFRNAIDKINKDRHILPRSKIIPEVDKLVAEDSFHASKRVCKMLKSGVAAIFGPPPGPASSLVQSIAETFDIPHFKTHWDMRERTGNFSINMYPHPSMLARAYIDLIRHFKWRSFAIVYEDEDSLLRLQDLLTEQFYPDKNVDISVRQILPGDDPRVVFKELKKNGETHIVLDCSTDRIVDILQKADQVQMMTEYQHYLVTSLDLHTVDLEQFRGGSTNITAFQIIDPDAIEKEQNYGYDRTYPGSTRNGRTDYRKKMKTNEALLDDAVKLYANALNQFDPKPKIKISMRPFSCDTKEKWVYGNGLITYIKIENKPPLYGLTGRINIDMNNTRTNFTLHVFELKRHDGLKKTGVWDSGNTTDNRLRMEQLTYLEYKLQASKSLEGKHLTVVIKLATPYANERENSSLYVDSNDRYEGYCIDLIKQIAEIRNFTYTIKVVPDNQHGNKVGKDWTGLIKELIEQRADIAVADLTVTSERDSAVDFTMPFMNLGISILIGKPLKKPPELFSFLAPMSIDVWLYMLAGYLGVSVLLFILARFNPYDWENPHPCDPDPDELENKFNLLNSMWFTIGSLMQQGSDIQPKAVSTRLVAGIWWFFTLIMISSYTANLAAFLTLDRIPFPIENVDDLSRQTKIKFGSMKSGTTRKFFMDSQTAVFKAIYSAMESDASVYADDNNDGVTRALKGGYAFFIESTSNEYFRHKYCNLTQIGGLLDAKSYGIATPEGSPYVFALSEAILNMQEEGKLLILRERWFIQKHGSKCESETKTASAAAELGLANVGGVFVVLLAGMGLSCILGVVEFIWKTKKSIKERRRSDLMEELKNELRFALKFKESKKPIRKKEESENGWMIK